VIYLSLAMDIQVYHIPPHALEITPCGEIPMRNLTVLWCLYEGHVWAQAFKVSWMLNIYLKAIYNNSNFGLK